MEHYTIKNGIKKSKKRHFNYKIAMFNANIFNSNINNIGLNKLYPYKCNTCQGYHLGKQDSNVNNNTINKSKIIIYTQILSKIKFTIDLSIYDKKGRKVKVINKIKL
tara:strand:- start:201 stop:521 length:321 start_codon:yes stop_codon:yes gene_type:complete